MLLDDLRAGSAGGNIASGDEHVDLVLAVLNVTLVVHHVDEGHGARERGQNDRDNDISDSIGHRLSRFAVAFPYPMSCTVRTPKVIGDPWPEVA